MQDFSGVSFHGWLPVGRSREISAMLLGSYWNLSSSRAEIERVFACSDVVVGAVDASTGCLVAVARAITDVSKRAWVYDVIVDEGRRGEGVGRRLMSLLLEHPGLRDVGAVHLKTRDADTFYRGLGFVSGEEVPRTPWAIIQMVRLRAVGVGVGVGVG